MKIAQVKEIFVETQASAATQTAILKYTSKAFEILNEMDLDDTSKQILKTFGTNLMARKV